MKYKLAFLLALSLLSNAYSQKVDVQEIEKLIKEKCSNYEPLACIVLVTKKGQTIYRNSFGLANVEMQVECQPDHKFRIGSNTKQFTAIATLKLVEEKRLALHDTIQQYLPQFPYSVKPITIENLLTHTSGISDYTSKDDWFELVSKTSKQPFELVEYFQNDSINFMPGEMFEYNNSGYHLLGCIIEKVTGKSYGSYLNEIIFSPLNMQNTLCLSTFDVVPKMASGYESINSKIVIPNFVHPAQPFSAGNIVSNVEDLSKWYKGLFEGRVVKKELLSKAITPFALNSGTNTHYGYGWQIDTIQNSPVIYHGGGYPGYISQTLYFLNEEVLVTVLTNSMPVEFMAKQIGAIAIEKPYPKKNYITLPKNMLKKFSGLFSNGTEKWLFTEIDGKFYYKIDEGNNFLLKPVKENLFYSEDWDIYCEFIERQEGNLIFVLHLRGDEFKYSKHELP